MIHLETEAGLHQRHQYLDCVEMVLAGHFDAPCIDFSPTEPKGATPRTGLWPRLATFAFPWASRRSG